MTDILDPKPGDFALFRNSTFDSVRVEFKEIEKVTPMLVYFVGRGWPRQMPKRKIVAVVADKQIAARIKQSIDGVAGEYNRRENNAREERNRRVASAMASANRSIDLILRDACK